MSRSKQPDHSRKDGATLIIDVDSFVRTRDSVVTGLATLQEAIQTLSTAYIKHTNAVLGEHGAGLDVDSTLAKLADNPLLRLGGDLRGASPALPAAEAAADGKKERKKRQHDPNAPKRPLTPFFLYMQTARPIIANDLGPDAAKGAVSAEGTRRWGVMDAHDKSLWAIAYKDNLRLYNARMHYYKAGHPEAKDMSDQDASIYAEQHNIGVDNTADAQLVGEAAATGIIDEEDADGEPEPEKEPTPPPKTPKVKASRKSKTKVVTPAEEPTPSSASIVPPKSAEKSVEKKRKRASKKGEEAAPEEKEDLAVETPKPAAKPRKKKAKNDA